MVLIPTQARNWQQVKYPRLASKAVSHRFYLQEAKRRVEQVLTGSGSGTDEEAKGAFTTVAEAVMSAGTAIGQFSSQMLGGGEVSLQYGCFLLRWCRCLVPVLPDMHCNDFYLG